MKDLSLTKEVPSHTQRGTKAPVERVTMTGDRREIEREMGFNESEIRTGQERTEVAYLKQHYATICDTF